MPETGPTRSNNFDGWLDSYAERAHTLSVSEVRALFAVVSRPEVVSLAGGMPYVSALPKELLAKSYESMMAKKGDLAIQYGGGQGDAERGVDLVRDTGHERADGGELLALFGIEQAARQAERPGPRRSGGALPGEALADVHQRLIERAAFLSC